MVFAHCDGEKISRPDDADEEENQYYGIEVSTGQKQYITGITRGKRLTKLIDETEKDKWNESIGRILHGDDERSSSYYDVRENEHHY